MTTTNTFAASLRICGLSQNDAAIHFDVRLDTVKSWASGRNPVPKGVWEALAELFERIQDAADNATKKIALDGIDLRAWSNIEADITSDPLPGGATAASGAMALLMAINDLQ